MNERKGMEPQDGAVTAADFAALIENTGVVVVVVVAAAVEW